VDLIHFAYHWGLTSWPRQ